MKLYGIIYFSLTNIKVVLLLQILDGEFSYKNRVRLVSN